MLRELFKRLVLSLLLVSNLIIGALAQGHPDMPRSAAAAHADMMQSSACPDHLTDEPDHDADASCDADAGQPTDKDCCKGASCECSCVQPPATVWPSLTATLCSDDRSMPVVDGFAQHRITELFRPPT